MKAAWLASIAAQALLALTLYRSGQRDWWTAYLAMDLVRSAALWSLSGLAYWAAYTLSQPPLMFAQFMAVQQMAHPRGPWHLTWLYGAAAISGWAVAFSPLEWPTARHASAMLWQGTAFICLAVLLGGRAKCLSVKVYYALGSVSAVAAQVSITPEWSVLVSTVHLVSLSLLFFFSVAAKNTGGLRANA